MCECAPGPIPHQSRLRQYARLCRERVSLERDQLDTSYQEYPASPNRRSASRYMSAWASSSTGDSSPRRICAASLVPGSTISE